MISARRLVPGMTCILVALLALPARAIDVQALVRQTESAVVLITAHDKQSKPMALGSGFFVNSSGLLVTNYHVIEGASGVLVKLHNGALFFVDKIVSIDSARDLALLKVAGRELPTLRLGDSGHVTVGEEVVALGSPLGYQNTVSTGIVSGIRQVNGRPMIQTTAPISHGNSGGPLLDLQGRVIGINTSTEPRGQNVNFAVPVNELKEVLGTPEKHGLTDRSLLSYVQGLLALNRKDYTAAQRELLESVTLDPAHFDAWVELGGLYYLLNDTEKELDAYKHAVSLRPTDDDAHYYLGTAYEEKGDFEAAAAEYEQTLSLNPKYVDALYEFALLELVRGHPQKAAGLYRRLQPLNYGLARKLYRILDLVGTAGGR